MLRDRRAVARRWPAFPPPGWCALLSDQGGRARKRYGVPAVLGLLPGRVTYVIDRQGTVRHVFNSMTNMGQHVNDALEMVRQLQAGRPA